MISKRWTRCCGLQLLEHRLQSKVPGVGRAYLRRFTQDGVRHWGIIVVGNMRKGSRAYYYIESDSQYPPENGHPPQSLKTFTHHQDIYTSSPPSG